MFLELLIIKIRKLFAAYFIQIIKYIFIKTKLFFKAYQNNQCF